ncbi:hypothetical protein MBLNU457_2171t2 [Dothideomycetes sp. NU457]
MHLQCLSTSKANTNTNLRNLPDPKPNEVFPFFKLCAELRVMILEECLVVGKVFPRPNPKDDERLDDIDQYKKPISQLLCVSRQMRREAAEIFLQKNIFVISCGPNSWPWRADFGPSTATLDSLYDLVTEHVCSLSICFDIRDAADPPAGMDRLDIVRSIHSHQDVDHYEQECGDFHGPWEERYQHYCRLRLYDLEFR